MGTTVNVIVNDVIVVVQDALVVVIVVPFAALGGCGEFDGFGTLSTRHNFCRNIGIHLYSQYHTTTIGATTTTTTTTTSIRLLFLLQVQFYY